MSNIEDDMKVMKEFVDVDRKMRQKEVESDYDKFCEKICIAIENVLSEREQDKARIKELEEELYSANKIVEEYLDGIPKQKIKDKIENLEKEYKKLEQSSDFIIADTIQPKIEVLQELLQESEDK